MNVDLLRQTWAEAESFGDDLILDFYTRLFLAHGELRGLFPDNMGDQRRHIHQMLNLVVRADNLEAVVPRLQRLGRDHRGYGAVAAHYPVVAETLLATLEHYLADRWTPEAKATWAEALGLVAEVMTRAAAEADARRQPHGWAATVYRTDRHDLDDGDTVDLYVAVADHPCAAGDTVPVSIPDQPGSRRPATVTGWAADGSLTVLSLAVTDLDPVTKQYARIEPGEQVHLGAPLDPVDEGAPHGG